MPKTIIKNKAFECKICGFIWTLPSGIEPTQEVCNLVFNKDDDFLQRTKGRTLGAWQCPNCFIKGENNTLQVNFDHATKTIDGEEDIENEILDLKINPDEANKKGIDISTVAKENQYRAKRLKDIQDAITEANKLR